MVSIFGFSRAQTKGIFGFSRLSGFSPVTMVQGSAWDAASAITNASASLIPLSGLASLRYWLMIRFAIF